MSDRRRIIKGVPVSSGIVVGHTHLVLPGDINVAEVVISASDVSREIAALKKAVDDTVADLRRLRASAGKNASGPVTKIFDALLLIADDQDFAGKVIDQIATRRRNAGFVYNNMVQQVTDPLKTSKDQYMRQMAGEVDAVAKRVLSHLAGFGQQSKLKFPSNTVLVGKSFAPGETLGYRNRKAAGLVVGEGGLNSHMALIARSVMMPVVVVDENWAQIPHDCPIIIDGTAGCVIIHPSETDISEYQVKAKRVGSALATRIKSLTRIPPRTSDGVDITVMANLELPGPADDILSSQRIPVGLYRTEFLYLENDQFPDEEQQYEQYLQIAEKFEVTTVVLRTFDLGADKVRSGDFVPHEDNPALGWRGIRMMLELEEAFRTQIRAMLRASVHKNIRILLPMISDVTEVDKARKLIVQVMADLRHSRIPYDPDVKIGVMIEVPAAALMADQLAPRVDFFSIGTNDLTQYTLSVDRNSTRVVDLYNPLHPAVLALVKMAIDAAVLHKIPVTICGEIAGDPTALPLFIGMGVREFSMSPAKIFDICRQVNRIDSHEARALTNTIEAGLSTTSVKRKLDGFAAALEKQ
jgi:phosphotransferase system enzyme I (PtsI)